MSRKHLLGGFAVAAMIAAPAMAADMSAKAPVYKAAPPPVVYDPWTGFYLGANAGYSWARWESSSAAAIFPTATGFAPTASSNVRGWLGGFQTGFNWRVDPRWLLGLEADFQWTGERASSDGFSSDTVDPNIIFQNVTTQATSNQWKFPWFATFRGRAGALVDPETLLYATGGLAVGRFKFSSQTTTTNQLFHVGIPIGPIVTVVGPTFSDSATRTGFAVGGGIEKKFTRNWSGKLEYLYLDFGTHTYFSGTGTDTSVRLRDNIVRVGINYTFD